MLRHVGCRGASPSNGAIAKARTRLESNTASGAAIPGLPALWRKEISEPIKRCASLPTPAFTTATTRPFLQSISTKRLPRA